MRKRSHAELGTQIFTHHRFDIGDLRRRSSGTPSGVVGPASDTTRDSRYLIRFFRCSDTVDSGLGYWQEWQIVQS